MKGDMCIISHIAIVLSAQIRIYTFLPRSGFDFSERLNLDPTEYFFKLVKQTVFLIVIIPEYVYKLARNVNTFLVQAKFLNFFFYFCFQVSIKNQVSKRGYELRKRTKPIALAENVK